jgi:hypothetical protein
MKGRSATEVLLANDLLMNGMDLTDETISFFPFLPWREEHDSRGTFFAFESADL